MAHILAFAMQKGGVAKTTSVLNIGGILAQRGARVLLVDLDAQASLTESLGVNTENLELTVYEVLLNPEHGAKAETLVTSAGVDLIPATIELAGAELELAGKVGRELLLREALEQSRNEYDYILIDPPPNLGLFTLNALAAADAAIVPVAPGVSAYRAMPRLENTIKVIRKLNPTLKFGGIFLTQVDRRKNLHYVIETKIREQYKDLVFDTVIPLNSKVEESPGAGQPVNLYAPGSQGDIAYAALAQELEARYGRQ